jgi:serine/threonine protein kinase
LRSSIADYQLLEEWSPSGSARPCFTAEAPARIGATEPVLVWPLDVDAEGWQQLCDHLVRLRGAASDCSLALLEVGPDLETGRVFLVTEAAPGGLLSDPSSPLTPGDRIRAVAAAARAVHAMHEVGLAHGFIRPENIFLTERGPRLGPPALDRPSGALASPGCAADLHVLDPDTLAGEAPSRASDIWALGATAHLLLTGRGPFPAPDDEAPVLAVQRILFGRPEVDPSLPPALRQVIGSCVAADPADRPSTALEVADSLSEAGSEL